ncbi:MAG: V-type ATP synthase subunit I [Bacteroidia bacterium]|nr:V-type ATP synthase subunit I [Bacteroidia bacterium]
MKKYTFLVYHKDYEHFLESLQEQGVLHVKERGSAEVESGELRDKLLLLNRISDAIKFLEKKIDPKNKAELALNQLEGAELLTQFDALRNDNEALVLHASNIGKDVAVLEPWGSIDWKTVEKLNNDGWAISFYSASTRNWSPEWETKYNAFQIAQNGTNILFVTITKKSDIIEIEADKIKLPRKVLIEALAEVKNLHQEKIRIDNEMRSFATKNLFSFKLYKEQVQQEFDFDKVVLNTNKAAEGKISLLEGFLPEYKEIEFKKFLDSEGVFYEASKPDIDDKVPVQLKNNRFARLFEPIGELYTLPNYNELDLTSLFAPFYLAFFGFCLGDAGYGLILSLFGFFMAKRVQASYKRVFNLISLLGLSTILFGFVSGTIFGMSLYELRPGFYANLDDLMKSKKTNINQLLFNLSLIFGAIQIAWGMCVKVANEIHQGGFRNAFSTIGWIFILSGLILQYALKKFLVDETIVIILISVLLSIGFLMAFIFSNPSRNVFVNFGLGFWDAYNMATGLMGDLLSYIRLFALSICGGILGYVFNSLAFALAPDMPVVRIIVIALILVIGHTINLMIGILGAFVHPMRLTFVEFYKNAGFSGGGKKYLPFRMK